MSERPLSPDPDPDPDAVAAGHAFCTRRARVVYDIAHVSANHLDVGVGTGWFLDKADFPSASPRLALMDLNENCLEAAAQRTSRYDPEVYVANVLEPIEVAVEPFDSVSLTTSCTACRARSTPRRPPSTTCSYTRTPVPRSSVRPCCTTVSSGTGSPGG